MYIYTYIRIYIYVLHVAKALECQLYLMMLLRNRQAWMLGAYHAGTFRSRQEDPPRRRFQDWPPGALAWPSQVLLRLLGATRMMSCLSANSTWGADVPRSDGVLRSPYCDVAPCYFQGNAEKARKAQGRAESSKPCVGSQISSRY